MEVQKINVFASPIYISYVSERSRTKVFFIICTTIKYSIYSGNATMLKI